MQYRALGKTGLNVSDISFGAWAIGGGWGPQDEDTSLKALHRAIDSGVNFIDTAAGYGNGKSEKLIAEALKTRSEQIFVATKTPPAPGIWPPSPYCDPEERYSEAYLRENIEERLNFLQTDSLDLLQLHSWTRAWNRNPKPLEHLQKFKSEGLIKAIGISTPEHDQNCAVDLMRHGLIDTVQIIYNLFEQEPAAELLPVALEHNVGVIVRVVFDEGVLTGKFTTEHQFPEGDFRQRYFAGDRLARAVERTEKIKADIADTALTMPQLALKYALSHPAVSTVIAGMRNTEQVDANCAASDLPALDQTLLTQLQAHNWRRAFWYSGK